MFRFHVEPMVCFSHRDSGESGQDTVSLSMSMSELDDPGDGKNKKKRGRPGRPPVCLTRKLFSRLTIEKKYYSWFNLAFVFTLTPGT